MYTVLEKGEADQPCVMLSDRTNFDRSPKLTSISLFLAQRIRETMLHSVKQPQNVTGCVGRRGVSSGPFSHVGRAIPLSQDLCIPHHFCEVFNRPKYPKLKEMLGI